MTSDKRDKLTEHAVTCPLSLVTACDNLAALTESSPHQILLL